jgi:Na+/H+ antiporter NhaD/arsenite permease-like protein
MQLPSLSLATIAASGPSLGELLPTASVAPFAVLLLAIAVLPLVAHHWWESNKNRAILSFGIGGAFVAWLLMTQGHASHHALEEAALDYLSFIALLGSLYVISGGIYIKGSLAGSPLANVSVLSIGAILANLIGTTGASMVLIRPMLRANQSRQKKTHIVIFFIFVVSNCAGMLTPLGDPPLFLGFLKGVPFEWTLNLWKEWILVNSILLALFFIVDSFIMSKEEKERPGAQLEEALKHEPLRIEGGSNILFLLGVVFVILGKGQGWGNGGETWPFGIQEGAMAVLGVLAYMTTKRATREANKFTFAPILEVAILFAGIFATMVAPLAILNARGKELGIDDPWQYYWATGALSSFLDNAPTYLTFAATACGQLGVPAEGSRYLAEFLAKGPEAVAILTAISCGAVMMGANTYIGNGPNFMVKAIAEENGVKMPSFFGYMAWSGAILIPIFVVITFVFFRG